VIKVFIPIDKGKTKADVRGFWRNDTGKIFYDYLKIKSYNYLYNDKSNCFYTINKLEALKIFYKQEALFFISNNRGYIFNDRDKIDVLINRIYREIKPGNFKIEIKEALRVYGGVTIYKRGNRYFMEIYYKKR